jgi:ACR3 family arsenite transporter
MTDRQLHIFNRTEHNYELVGASNFFELAVATAISELAVATAISLFGFQSGAALATVVGVLVEVPVMLLVVKIANATQHWYELGEQN